MIVIVDYGMGNVSSVRNMISKVGGCSVITGTLDSVDDVTGIVLPGVGAFDHAVARLSNLGITGNLKSFVLEKKVPFLGICLGMQLLFESSEEGKLPGLGILHGQAKRFTGGKFDTGELKVPHMGWNTVSARPGSIIFNGLTEESRFYFVHSYHVVCDCSNDIAGTCSYGCEFTCAVTRENIHAVQFHPEKSHRFGMKIFENFLRLTSC